MRSNLNDVGDLPFQYTAQLPSLACIWATAPCASAPCQASVSSAMRRPDTPGLSAQGAPRENSLVVATKKQQPPLMPWIGWL